MNRDDKEDLAGIVENAVSNVDSTKEAIDTLHPQKDINSKRLDKLSNLNMTQVDAMGVLEWQDKALNIKPGNWGKNNVTEGFTDKIKGLLVSLNREGRLEVSNVFKPSIIGQMLQDGQMPEMMGSVNPRHNFMSRLMGRR